jgi:hypothetical protein
VNHKLLKSLNSIFGRALSPVAQELLCGNIEDRIITVVRAIKC